MKQKRIFIGFFVLTLLIISICFYLFSNNKERVILYSWDFGDVSLEKKDNLYYVINKLNIDTLYQTFSSDYLNGNDSTFIDEVHNKNILVYHLTGEREWGLGDDMQYIYNEIDMVYNFNKNNNDKIDGIAFDIEPYILDEWEDSSLEVYVSKMKKAYKYACNKGVYFILVIPYWYDNIDLGLLKELFKSAGDEFSIMNYRIKSSISNIKNEVRYARLYNKKLNTIAEVGFSGDDKFDSFIEIDKDFKRIKDYYRNFDISIAYHDYSTISKELFK